MKKKPLLTRLSFILAIMLLNSCATSSNSSFYVNEELQNENFSQVLSAKDLFFINDSNAEKSILNRDLVLEALKYKSLDKDQWDALMLLSESNYLKPFGKKVIDQLIENKRKLQEVKSIRLSINVDERYKNYLIQAATNIDKRINIIFDEEISKIDISLNVLNKSLPGFCNSFQNDQLNSVEKVIFSNDLLQAKDTLIIYEDIFSGRQYKLKNKYTNVRSALYSDEQFDIFASNALGVSESLGRYKKINALLPNIKINSTPRVRQDIKNIYFLMTYKNAKGLVPAFRYNYSIGINSYASINLIENISNISNTADFEYLIIPIQNQFKDDVSLNQFEKNSTIEDRLIYDNLFDLIMISYLSHNNIKDGMLNGRSGMLTIKKGRCTSRELPLSKINSEGSFTLP